MIFALLFQALCGTGFYGFHYTRGFPAFQPDFPVPAEKSL